MMKRNRLAGSGCLILIALLASACAGNAGSNQQILPTLAVLASFTPAEPPTATITETPTVRPTDDINAMSATGEAAINPIRKPLEQFPDFQGLRKLDAIMLAGGVSINIDANVAPADDNEDTMGRVLVLVQKHVSPISQIRVNAWNNDQPISLWLWEDGQWTVTRIAAAAPVTTVALVCPKNCDEAVALGWTEQQAGQCSNLDRDHDGVACYGN